MKTTILTAIMLLTFSICQAQIHLGATIGPQIPVGDFGNGFKTGFGINVVGKYMLKENIAIGLNLGYNKFGSDLSGVSASMVPITALIEYQFGTEKFKPYVGAELGLYSFGEKIKIEEVNVSSSKVHFGFAPTAGILYGLNDKISLCANLKLNDVFGEGSSATWIGINLGAIFKIK